MPFRQSSGDLPGAITLLAASVFTLAAVFARIERGNELRHLAGGNTRSSENEEAAPSTPLAVTNGNEAVVAGEPMPVSDVEEPVRPSTATARVTADIQQDSPSHQAADIAAERSPMPPGQASRSAQGPIQGQLITPTSGDVDGEGGSRRSSTPQSTMQSPTASEVAATCNRGSSHSVLVGRSAQTPQNTSTTDSTRQSVVLEEGCINAADQAADNRQATISSESKSAERRVSRSRGASQSPPPSRATLPTSSSHSPPKAHVMGSPGLRSRKQSTLDTLVRPRSSLLTDCNGHGLGSGRGATAVSDPLASRIGDGRRLEILVHNVSHKDMVLSLRKTRHPAPDAHDGEKSTEIHGSVLDAVRDLIVQHR